jgi:hypothetical protein
MPSGSASYLMESGTGTDRIGALNFQCSAIAYVPRSAAQASLDERMQSA